MENRIRAIRVSDHRLDPAQAEVCLTVYPEHLSSVTQVRGRLMGPRCPYSTTVEVAYPLREHSRTYESEGDPSLTLRVIIPEPSFWEPESPFLYQGPVELWEKGQRCDQVPISHGLRVIRLGPRGLRVNSRLLTIRGVACDRLSEEDAHRLRRAGYNTLLVPITADTAGLGDIADRFGFLVLGRIASKEQLAHVEVMAGHASYLGWLVDTESLFAEQPLLREVPSVLTSLFPGYFIGQEALVGVEVKQAPPGPVPPGVSFLACTEELLPGLAEVNLPKIILGKEPPDDDKEKTKAAASRILGWIDRG